MDAVLRGPESPLGSQGTGLERMYENARQLMFNPHAEAAFTFREEESLRYGNTG